MVFATSTASPTYNAGVVPALAGTWVGLKLYGHLDEVSFRKIVLLLLLISGIALVVPAFAPLFG